MHATGLNVLDATLPGTSLNARTVEVNAARGAAAPARQTRRRTEKGGVEWTQAPT